MKMMTCRQLGGACDLEFHAATFEEIAEQSKAHGTDMYKVNDPSHMKAMGEMQELMKDPKAMNEWFQNKRKEFNALPDKG